MSESKKENAEQQEPLTPVRVDLDQSMKTVLLKAKAYDIQQRMAALAAEHVSAQRELQEIFLQLEQENVT